MTHTLNFGMEAATGCEQYQPGPRCRIEREELRIHHPGGSQHKHTYKDQHRVLVSEAVPPNPDPAVSGYCSPHKQERPALAGRGGPSSEV